MNKKSLGFFETDEDYALCQKWLRPVHMRYLRYWQERLGLDDCTFVLTVRKGMGDALASVAVYPHKIFVIKLTTRTLLSRYGRNGWRNSINHELCHAFFHIHYSRKDKRQFSRRSEDEAVEVLSRIFGKESR